MRAILVQQRVSKALDDPETYPDELKEKSTEIVDMNEIAYGSIILHLSDNIVRQVDGSKTARVLRSALDTLFLTKTLPNKIYLLEKLFIFKIDTSKDLEANLSDFNIKVKSLSHNGKDFSNEDLTVILLNFLSDSYKEVKNAIKYAMDTLTQAIVIDALRSRDLEVRKEFKRGAREESHFVRGRTKKMDGNNYHKKVVEVLGNIAIRMHNGMVRIIHNVRYVPKLKRNLIFLGVLEDDRYWFKSKGSVLKIIKGSMVVMKGPKKNGMYYL
ncbi:Retrovirus-related Pol polyprotein from transposon TNT 1-94 [Abeliophyllum distichum]|uniref:Retrovirus-related Pol polyprotein from transposon TNT 1-94 n=1 Tax=Abeliophyllum distichum TaxID=126358 RepID=A0ABD1Q7V9_9LAMI